MFPTKECFLLSIVDAMICKERYAIIMHQVCSSRHCINRIKHGTFSFEKECERVHLCTIVPEETVRHRYLPILAYFLFPTLVYVDVCLNKIVCTLSNKTST